MTKALSGLIYNYTHSYGAGPNPISGDSNNTHPAWMQITYNNAPVTVSYRPMLHDNSVQLTSGKLYAIQSGITISSSMTNSSGYATLSLVPGTYNFTVFDDKNFEVYKELNTVIIGNLAKTVSTYDTPFNCVALYGGYQSDFILRINDTDGTHITNITTPTCPYPYTALKFNMTFTEIGRAHV